MTFRRYALTVGTLILLVVLVAQFYGVDIPDAFGRARDAFVPCSCLFPIDER